MMAQAQGASGRDRPVRVLWHMHRGMLRFYGKFFRDRAAIPAETLARLEPIIGKYIKS